MSWTSSRSSRSRSRSVALRCLLIRRPSRSFGSPQPLRCSVRRFSSSRSATTPTAAWRATSGTSTATGSTTAARRKIAHAFGTAGTKAVRLRVIDNAGTPSAVATETFTVSPPPANRLPVAQFSVSDLEPAVDQQISLRSFSYDPDGSITAQRWDLDGDGRFDENVTGPTAFTAFLHPGPKILRLRVEDSAGGFQTQTVNLTVTKRAASSSLMYPFPVIRLAGSVLARGARVRTLRFGRPDARGSPSSARERAVRPSASPGRPPRDVCASSAWLASWRQAPSSPWR